VSQNIGSHNATDRFNENAASVSDSVSPSLVGPAHRVVVGGRSVMAAGAGDASFVSISVGVASNTGGAALTP